MTGWCGIKNDSLTVFTGHLNRVNYRIQRDLQLQQEDICLLDDFFILFTIAGVSSLLAPGMMMILLSPACSRVITAIPVFFFDPFHMVGLDSGIF